MRGQKSGILMVTTLLAMGVAPAAAQSTNTDARTVAMGGSPGSSDNIAAAMVQPATPDRVIPIPLGLIHVFKGGFDKFNPTSDSFDPVRALEVASSPLHYTFGREESSSGQIFINDLVNGRLNPNLTSYVGFAIPETLRAEGLASPSFGGTIKFAKGADRFHGIYIGAGPYLSFDTQLDVDPRLADMLGNGVRYPNVQMAMRNQSKVQLAMAVTIGYRGRLPIAAPSSADEGRDGVYVAFNYHVLKGFRYLQPDALVRFDTNAAGNLIPAPATTPLSIASIQGRSGKGRSADIGVQFVRGYIEAGFGVNGIGNRIDWSDFSLTTYSLPNLISDLEFTEIEGIPPVTELRVELPVVKTGNVAFRGFGWGAMASATDGFNGKSFHGGIERQLGPVWLRGGGKYTRGHWDPTYGIGVGDRVALDVGFYGSRANLEGRRMTTMAISVRIRQNQN